VTGSTDAEDKTDAIQYGNVIAVGDRGLLITGAAGSGKTSLTLEMIALGAELVADDRVCTDPDGDGGLWLSAPRNLAGLVEVRGFGLIRLDARPRVALCLVADLDRPEPERVPPRRQTLLSGIAWPLILCKGRPGLAAALTCILRAEEWLSPEALPGRDDGG
jgi:hypothetical protein